MEGFLGALVALLLGISIVLYRYCKHLLNKSRQFAENIDDLKGLLEVYSMHLQQTLSSSNILWRFNFGKFVKTHKRNN